MIGRACKRDISTLSLPLPLPSLSLYPHLPILSNILLRALSFARGLKNSCTHALSRLITALQFSCGFINSVSVCRLAAYRGTSLCSWFQKKVSDFDFFFFFQELLTFENSCCISFPLKKILQFVEICLAFENFYCILFHLIFFFFLIFVEIE